MKDEVLTQYLGKKVQITFFDGEVLIGIFGKHDTRFVEGWKGKGYHLTECIRNNNFLGNLGFKKSHIKKIEEICK